MIPAGNVTARHGVYARRRIGVIALLASLITIATLFTGPSPAHAALPTPIAASTARTYLYELPVRSENRSGYDRDKFPHWIGQGNNCNTREVVLKRDGSNVRTNSSCYPTSGSWYSQYDGRRWYSPSDVDIDHVVPLAEAWESGARNWSTSRRQAFANDLTQPQLIAVTDNVNQSKGDKDPAEWLPRSSYRCTYVRAWIDVKHHYDLSVNTAERNALRDTLNNYC